MNYSKPFCLFLLSALLLLAGCAAKLPEYNEQGYAIVIFPAYDSSAVWTLQREGGGAAPRFVSLGGAYRAAVLEPGLYALSGIYNMHERSASGFGHKDLDFADRQRGRNIPRAELANSLGLVQVKRLPIKEERGGGEFSSEHVVKVSSEYRMRLELPATEVATFSAGAGEVLLLPALRGELVLNEQACSRNGFVLDFNPLYILSYDPEDLDLLEWYCPLNKLTLSLATASLDDLKAAADPKKLPPELLGKVEVRGLKLGPYMEKATKYDGREPGLVNYVFSGP